MLGIYGKPDALEINNMDLAKRMLIKGVKHFVWIYNELSEHDICLYIEM